MFNWVVKVVPQPPEVPGTEEDAKGSAANNNKTREGDSASVDSQTQAGVLGWLSNGFVSALPQPAGSPLIDRSNSETRAENGERAGVIGWVSQGLTRVLPQPDDKYKETRDPNEEHTEVYEVEKMPDFDPLPHIPVVEMHSDDEGDGDDMNPKFPPNVVNWIKQMVPQPVMLPPGAVAVEPTNKSTRSSLDKILSPPPESLSGISLDTDSKASGVIGWFVSGLGLKLPQPALPTKDEPQTPEEILQKGGKALRAP